MYTKAAKKTGDVSDRTLVLHGSEEPNHWAVWNVPGLGDRAEGELEELVGQGFVTYDLQLQRYSLICNVHCGPAPCTRSRWRPAQEPHDTLAWYCLAREMEDPRPRPKTWKEFIFLGSWLHPGWSKVVAPNLGRPDGRSRYEVNRRLVRAAPEELVHEFCHVMCCELYGLSTIMHEEAAVALEALLLRPTVAHLRAFQAAVMAARVSRMESEKVDDHPVHYSNRERRRKKRQAKAERWWDELTTALYVPARRFWAKAPPPPSWLFAERQSIDIGGRKIFGKTDFDLRWGLAEYFAACHDQRGERLLIATGTVYDAWQSWRHSPALPPDQDWWRPPDELDRHLTLRVEATPRLQSRVDFHWTRLLEQYPWLVGARPPRVVLGYPKYLPKYREVRLDEDSTDLQIRHELCHAALDCGGLELQEELVDRMARGERDRGFQAIRDELRQEVKRLIYWMDGEEKGEDVRPDSAANSGDEADGEAEASPDRVDVLLDAARPDLEASRGQTPPIAQLLRPPPASDGQETVSDMICRLEENARVRKCALLIWEDAVADEVFSSKTRIGNIACAAVWMAGVWHGQGRAQRDFPCAQSSIAKVASQLALISCRCGGRKRKWVSKRNQSLAMDQPISRRPRREWSEWEIHQLGGAWEGYRRYLGAKSAGIGALGPDRPEVHDDAYIDPVERPRPAFPLQRAGRSASTQDTWALHRVFGTAFVHPTFLIFQALLVAAGLPSLTVDQTVDVSIVDGRPEVSDESVVGTAYSEAEWWAWYLQLRWGALGAECVRSALHPDHLSGIATCLHFQMRDEDRFRL
jgi:hypothetical protein